MSEQGDYRLLLVGCGELGSRHLQAIASLPQVSHIDVVDPRPEALALGQQRLSEISGSRVKDSITWLPTLEEASPAGHLCIVATQAAGRCQLVKEISQKLKYSSFLVEKLVAQSVVDMEDLARFADARELSIWVNCKDRVHSFHQRVKQYIDPADPIVFSAVGGNHGLATNGIHAADLFAFHDNANFIESTSSEIDPILHSSKRGHDLFELSGTLQGHTAKGSRFTLSYAPDHDNSELISISTRNYRCVIDRLQDWAVESQAKTGWSWQEIPCRDQMLVSSMTREFAGDILSSASCSLPTLSESMTAHRFILNTLQPHFGRLLDRELEYCPVT